MRASTDCEWWILHFGYAWIDCEESGYWKDWHSSERLGCIWNSKEEVVWLDLVRSQYAHYEWVCMRAEDKVTPWIEITLPIQWPLKVLSIFGCMFSTHHCTNRVVGNRIGIW